MNFIKTKATALLITLIILFIEIILYTSIVYIFYKEMKVGVLRNISFFVYQFTFFILGFVTARLEKKRGLLSGLIIGLIGISLVIIPQLFFHIFTTDLLIKNICAVFCSMLGGLIGVNLFRKQK